VGHGPIHITGLNKDPQAMVKNQAPEEGFIDQKESGQPYRSSLGLIRIAVCILQHKRRVPHHGS
jgi:hypothetical protein